MNRFKVEKMCIFCNSPGEGLYTPKDQTSLEVVLNAAKMRDDKKIVAFLGKSIDEITYHNQCRKSYVNKRTLELISRKGEGPSKKKKIDTANEIDASLRETNTSSSNTYVDKCIFCLGIKYMKGKNDKEPLSMSATLDSDHNVRKTATSKGDTKIHRILDWHYLTASNVKYHKSCYREYVRDEVYDNNGTTVKQCSNSKYEHFEDVVKLACDEYRKTYMKEDEIIELSKVTNMVEKHRNLSLTDKVNQLSYIRKRIKINLQSEVDFIQKDLSYVCYMIPKTVLKKQLLMKLMKLQKDIDEVRKCHCATDIRAEIIDKKSDIAANRS